MGVCPAFLCAGDVFFGKCVREGACSLSFPVRIDRIPFLWYDDSNTATTWHNLSPVYLAVRDPDSALRYSDRALVVLLRVLGPEHPYTTGTKRFNDYLHQLSVLREMVGDDFLGLLEQMKMKLDGPDAPAQ